jgi:phytoene dehydrogenase-like protein
MAAAYDTLVIGAGLNGLTAGAYLARGGQRVLVLERRAVVGGFAASEEIAPGFRVDAGAHDVGWVPPGFVQELELARRGVELVHPEPCVFAPLAEGGHLLIGRDRARTAESIRAHSPADAKRWGAFTERAERLAGFLAHAYAALAPSVTGTDLTDLFALLALGRRARGLGRTEMMELLRTLPMSVAELLDDWFESDALKGAVGAGGVTGILQGPRSAGTAFVLLHRQVGAGAVRGRAVVRGGTGALARALADAAREHGAEIRTGAEVARILVRDGRAVGVVLASGEEIPARRIASSADPRRTLLGLAGPAFLEPELVRAVQNIKFRGAIAKVNLALGELPRFSALSGDGAHLRGAIVVAPYLEARIPSLHDPALAPSTQHVMSVLVQYAPYRLKEGAWDAARREALGDLVIDTLAEHAPNLRSAVIARQVRTPRDLEDIYGLTEGNVTQGELTLDQILFMRPLPGWSRYRTPIRGLYLCGVGTHPADAVVGGPGRLAAGEILRGAKRKAEREAAVGAKG